MAETTQEAPTVNAGQAHPSGPAAPSPVELTAYCLLKLNEAKRAEELLKPVSEAERGGYSLYYLGVALARQGRVSEAITCLRGACRESVGRDAARKALLALLKQRVERCVSRKDLDGAGKALAEAMEIAPDDPDLQRHISELGSYIPVAYLKANRRREAASTWEEAQKRDPSDSKAAHSLGLLYFWSAQESERQGKGEEASEAWKGAVRNWVLLSHMDAFWTGLRGEREQVCGAVPDEAVAALRRKLTDALVRKFSDFQNEYLQQERKADARNMRMLSLRLALELKTAEALCRLTDRLRDRRKMPPICGPLMLEHLGELGTAQSVLAVAEQRLADEECTKQLHWCLSPWALPWIMLEERQYEDAIEYLGEEVKRKASSQDANNLLARAYLEHGRQLSRGENIEQALSAWLCGLDHARDPGIQQQIREEAEQEAVEHAIRLQRENGRENLERAIKLLEDVRAVADTPRVRKNLAEFYSSLGILEGNDESQDLRTRTAKAQRLLKKALEVDPDNVKAKHNLGATMVGEIMDLYERGKTKQAIDKARQAYKMAPGRDDVKMLLSRLLSDVGVERFKADDYAEGVRLLREAYQVDPTNEHAMTNLSRALANYGIFQCNRGNMSEGKRLVEEALRVDPTNEHAKETLLQLMMQGY